MATKLGAEPWKLNLPKMTVMIVGYDTFHDTGKCGGFSILEHC